MDRCVAALCACWISMLACEHALAELSAVDLLQAYISSTKENEHVQFDATTVHYEQGGAFEDEQWMDAISETIYIDLPAWRFRRRIVGRSYWRNRWTPYDYEYERVLADTNFLVRRATDVTAEFSEQAAQTALATPAPKGQFNAYVRFPENSLENGPSILVESVPSILYGYVFCDGRKFIGDTMAKDGVMLRDDPEWINGVKTIVIYSDGPLGRHTLWLDPEAGHLPRRILVEKSGNDLYGEKELRPISSIPAHGRNGDRRPNLPKKSCRYEVDDIRIEFIDSIPMIIGYNFTFTSIYAGNIKHIRRESVSLKNIQRNPDPAGLELTMEIPNGTPVTIEEHTVIPCEWRDGQIVKVVDNSVVSTLADVAFQTDLSRMRSWLVVANVAIIVVIIAILVRRQWLGASR